MVSNRYWYSPYKPQKHDAFGAISAFLPAEMLRMMNLVGRPDTQLYEIAGHGHGAMGNPAYHILIQSINKILGKKYEF